MLQDEKRHLEEGPHVSLTQWDLEQVEKMKVKLKIYRDERFNTVYNETQKQNFFYQKYLGTSTL